MAYGLFLDDDHMRHAWFRSRIEPRHHLGEGRIIYTFTAAQAIEALRHHDGEIAEAFLDHDLCEEDQCIAPGAPSKVPTGMVVVDYIVAMRRPPARITIHSFNRDAALVMCSRLAALPAVAVQRVPFDQLLTHVAPRPDAPDL